MFVVLDKMEILYCISYSIQHYKVYWDPDKGKVIADSVTPTTPIAYILTTCCLFSMFYRFT